MWTNDRTSTRHETDLQGIENEIRAVRSDLDVAVSAHGDRVVALRIRDGDASSRLITQRDDCDVRNRQTGVLIRDLAGDCRRL